MRLGLSRVVSHGMARLRDQERRSPPPKPGRREKGRHGRDYAADTNLLTVGTRRRSGGNLRRSDERIPPAAEHARASCRSDRELVRRLMRQQVVKRERSDRVVIYRFRRLHLYAAQRIRVLRLVPRHGGVVTQAEIACAASRSNSVQPPSPLRGLGSPLFGLRVVAAAMPSGLERCKTNESWKCDIICDGVEPFHDVLLFCLAFLVWTIFTSYTSYGVGVQQVRRMGKLQSR